MPDRAARRLEVTSFDGIRFLHRAGTCDEEVLGDWYWQERVRPPDFLGHRDETVVDAGAHIGAFALPAAKRARDGHVYALEAGGESFDLLCRNVELNNLRNVTPLHAALAARPGSVILHHGEDSWAHSTDPGAGSGPGELAPAQTLEGLMRAQSLIRIDCLKMNIEGGEYEVLLDSPPDALRRVGWLWVEYHPHPAHGGAELAARLRELGFEVATEESDSEPGKGWLIGSRPGWAA